MLIVFMVLFLLVTIGCLNAAIVLWPSRSQPIVRPLIGLQLCAAVWMSAVLFQVIAPDMQARALWVRVSYFGIGASSLMWLLFCLEATGRWIPASYANRRVAALALPIVVFLALAWTNDAHQLIWTAIRVEPGGQTFVLHGPGFWAFSAVQYLYFMIGFVLAALTGFREPSRRRRHMVAIVAIAGAAILVNLTYLTEIAWVDWTPMALGLGTLIYTRVMRAELPPPNPTLTQSALINLMSEGVIVVDDFGRLISANDAAARLLNVRLANQHGVELASLVQHENLASELLTHAETQFTLNIDGRTRIIEASRTPLTQRGRTEVGYVLLLRDVTDEVEARKTAFDLRLEQERVNVLGNFIQAATHEFRTPLSIIKASLFMAGRVDDPDKRRLQMSKIEQQVQRLNRLLDQVETMVELDAGRSMTIQPVDLNDCLRAVLADLQQEITTHELQTVLSLDASLPHIRADRGNLLRVFAELVSNAVLYSPRGGRVEVRSQRTDDDLQVSVTNSGPRLSAEVQGRMFERLYRGDPSRSTPGFGLGLPIAQQIVRTLGGEIEVTSDSVTGTCVAVHLPAAVMIESRARPAASSDPADLARVASWSGAR